MSDEDAAKLANRFELPGAAAFAEAFWRGPVDRPDVRPASTAESAERLTFLGLWRHALGFGRDR